MSDIRKIVVYTGALGYPVQKGIASLLETLPDAELRILLHRPPRPPARYSTGPAYREDALLANPRITLLRVDNINGAQSADEIRAFAPDFGISLAAPVLKQAVLASARKPDIYNMLRTGINYNFSHQAFAARLEGLT